MHNGCQDSESIPDAYRVKVLAMPWPAMHSLPRAMPYHSQESIHACTRPLHTTHCPDTISYSTLHRLSPFANPPMHLTHWALISPFPSALSCASPSNERFRVSRCAIRDDATRRCRVDSVLRRGSMRRRGCDKASVVEFSVAYVPRYGTTCRIVARGDRAHASTSD
jgi:hypothetical protein